MDKQKTLVILKPDCVQGGLVDEILSVLGNSGLSVLKREDRILAESELILIYREHENNEIFPDLISYMLSGQSVILILSGVDSVSKIRQLKGRTGSGKGIRGKYSLDFLRNVIHSAETIHKTNNEIKIFFPMEDLNMNSKKVIFGLSGMTESGKSTAGMYFDLKGVKRLKIVKILDKVRLEHKPQMTTDDFVSDSLKNEPDWLRQSFADRLLEEMSELGIQYCSLESMGDPGMVAYMRSRFPGEFFCIYVDATLKKRLQHQMIRKNLTDIEEAKKILIPKDEFKETFWEMPEIKEIADVIIDNNGSISEFESQLDDLLQKHGII